MKSYLRTGFVEVENTINEEGELLGVEIKKHTYIADNKEEFFLCYTSLLGVFMDMTIAEIRTLAYILTHYADGAKFDLSKKIRLDIAETSGLKERSIYNIIPNLEEKKMIVKIQSTGLYQVNPRYAFKGSTMDRNKQLKMILELHCKDC